MSLNWNFKDNDNKKNRRITMNNNYGNVRRCNMKASARINILKTQQKSFGNEKFKEAVGMALGDLTPAHLGGVLDKYAQENETISKMINVTGWYTVNISNCQDVSHSSIELALKYAMLPLKVQLYDFKRLEAGAAGQFLVDNTLMANRLKRLNGKVSVLFSSQIIDIRVQPGLPPFTRNLSDPLLLFAMKAALQARYNPKSHTLLLSRFHATAELMDQFVPLHVPQMLQRLLQLIVVELPQLRVLQLRDNFLRTLLAFKNISRASLPALQLLDVSANRIEDLQELKNLCNMQLQTLNITGNPLAKCPLWQLRNMLPQVLKIQGCNNKKESSGALQLPSLPPTTNCCIGVQFCIQFAKMFFDKFDKPSSRSELEVYYDAEAKFTLSVPEQLLKETQCYSNAYRRYNRNHLHTQSSIALLGKLRAGLPYVMQALGQLPEMSTNLSDVRLDIHTYEDKLRIFTLSGCCKELIMSAGNATWQLRNFTRMFVMHLNQAKFLIIHDMLNMELGEKQQPDDKPIAASETAASLDAELEELSNYMPKLLLTTENTTKEATSVEPSKFDKMPPLVPRAVINVSCKLEREIEDTLLCSDDEMLLVINEDVLLDDIGL